MATPRWLRQRRRNVDNQPSARKWRRRLVAALALLTLGVGANIAAPLIRSAVSAGPRDTDNPYKVNSAVWVQGADAAALGALGGEWDLILLKGSPEGDLAFQFSADNDMHGIRLDVPLHLVFEVPAGAVPASSECAFVLRDKQFERAIDFTPVDPSDDATRRSRWSDYFECVIPPLGAVQGLYVFPSWRLPNWPPRADVVGSWSLEVLNNIPVPANSFGALPFSFRSYWPTYDPADGRDLPVTVRPKQQVAMRFGHDGAHDRWLAAADTMWLLAGLAYGAIPSVLVIQGVAAHRRRTKSRR